MKRISTFTALSFMALITPSLTYGAWIDGAYYFGHQMPGTTLDVELVPQKPTPGEPFLVRISGTATQVCPPANFGSATTNEFSSNFLYISGDTMSCHTNEDGEELCSYSPPSCDLADLPIDFEYEVSAPASVWDHLDPALPASLYIQVTTGVGSINPNPPILRNKTAIWQHELDLLRGTHAIPPRLGSGYWISKERPNEGLLVQQQGNRMVAYELAYGEELTAEGNHAGTWIYSQATIESNSANGPAIKFARPDLTAPDVVPEQVKSASFIIDDVNHVRALFDAAPVKLGAEDDLFYTPYRRWVFNKGEEPFPVTVPDFSGEWTLIRYDGATELERETALIGEGAWLDTNRWRFLAVNGGAALTCKVEVRTGIGHCVYQADDSAEKVRFELADFNGNIAQGAWLDSADEPVNDAIFLRAPYDLP